MVYHIPALSIVSLGVQTPAVFHGVRLPGSGGYGRAELEVAGAYQVYEVPFDLLRWLDEVGVRAAV